jgi:AraC-like DNA-binding protein
MTIQIGVFLSLFLSLILISKKNKAISDWILFAWLVTIAITLTLFILQTNKERNTYPSFLGWGFPFPLLQWPFLYLYVSTLTSKDKLNFKSLLHFIPFFLSILLFANYLFLPNSTKLSIYNQHGAGFETHMSINLIAIILSAIIYTIVSLNTLWKYKKSIKNEFSYLEKINLNWLLYIIIGMTCILLIILSGLSDKYIFSSITGLVIFIGYFGIKQVGVFSQIHSIDNTLNINSPFNKLKQYTNKNDVISTSDIAIKYQKSTLNEDAILKIHEDLKELMKSHEIFKNAELTLDILSEKLNVLPNHLSQVINSIENKNFYDYINQLRIEEFKSLITKPEKQKYTLLALAFECGFNSKTSFNRNFKKVTGFTPSEYIQKEKLKIRD